MKVKIAFDARTLEKRCGSKVYAENLISRVKNLEKYEITLYGADRDNLNSLDPAPKSTYLRPLWENIAIVPFVKSNNEDIFHGLKNFLPIQVGQKNVVTVHDTLVAEGSYFRPHSLYWKTFFKKYINRAHKVIAISKSTKKDLIDLGIPETDIEVIYHGYNKSIFHEHIRGANKKLKNRYTEHAESLDDYILNVGTLKYNKNQKTLIRSFAKVSDDTEANLVIIGRNGGYKSRLNDVVKKNKIEERVIFLDYVPVKDLPLFYKSSNAFVFPSIKEGFGLPPLEAMVCGTPVITSNTSSLPEVVGDAGITVDPRDTNQLAEKIQKVLENEKLREDMKAKGLERAGKFSWEKTARETIDVYKEVLQ